MNEVNFISTYSKLASDIMQTSKEVYVFFLMFFFFFLNQNFFVDTQKNRLNKACGVLGPCGVLGRVWYLIVSIPDLCLLTYFLRTQNTCLN